MSTPKKRWRSWLGRAAGGVLVLCGLVLLGGWLLLRGSLAKLDGEVTIAGLHGKVTATRDALGIPTITGSDRGDVAYALGYLHGQDRFFQMDLLRRVAAGELSALFGAPALEVDRQHRVHRFRARAEAAVPRIPASERQLLQRYVDGVNAGLQALAARPFEYALLRLTPQPWQPADTLLAVWAMYFDLQGNQEARELTRGWLKEHTTAEQLAVLLPSASTWDAPLDAPAVSEAPAPLPASAPAWLGHPGPKPRLAATEMDSAVGSNNWALAGSRSTHADGAMIANDMHLGIRLPHIWYRAVLCFPGPGGQPRRIAGVTLPGAFVVVVGSNGRVAWGFTNSYGDYLDLVELERDPADPRRFKTPAGWEVAQSHAETIAVKGAPAETLTVLETSVGPVRQVGTHAYAVHWIAHDPDAVNLNLLAMEDADDLASAQAAGNRAGMPAQNMVAGDSAGHIGWTIAGPLPSRRAVPAASFPYAAAESALHWQGVRAPADYPRVLDPPGGQLWTANARQLAGEAYGTLGDGGADFGSRAQQIRDDLTQLGKTDERGVYGVALDDRALFLGTWRARALKTLDEDAQKEKPQRAEFRRLLEQSWDGRASVDSVGYQLAYTYLRELYTELFGTVDAELAQWAPGTRYGLATSRWPVVLARLLDEHPAGWLPPGHKDWRAVELDAIDRAIAIHTQDGQPLSAATWGKHNTARIKHPFARFLPMFADRLSAPPDRFPGGEYMPRVAGPDFGQSERMAVTPGHEERGILTMPGGQSGHPLSPYFLAGHAAWVRGDPVPFLPGPPEHTLSFVPR